MYQISKLLTGRTENQVRNRYATLIRHGIADSYKLIDDRTMSSGLHVDASRDHVLTTWTLSNYDNLNCRESISPLTNTANFSSRIRNNTCPAVDSYTSNNGLLLENSNVHKVDHNHECYDSQCYENAATHSSSINPNYFYNEDTSSSFLNHDVDCYQGDTYDCKGLLNQLSHFP